jgi:hypothetical protein
MFNEVRDACMALIVIAVTVIVLIALAKAGSGIQPRQNLIQKYKIFIIYFFYSVKNQKRKVYTYIRKYILSWQECR